MNPIFFPSTWIPESLRGLLFACFQQVTVLQPALELVPKPLRRMGENGRLNICLPDEEADEGTVEDLPNLLGDYHAWADLHQGERPAFHKFASLYASGPGDASIAWIRSKIRNLEGENTAAQVIPGGNATDPLLMSRLFVAIAQEYDQQDESLSRDLHTIDNLERNMLRDLAPDQPAPPDISVGASLPDDREAERPMPSQRLAAWRRLFAHLRQSENPHLPTPATFFVTGDREALQMVLDAADAPEVVCRIVGIPPGGEDKPFVNTAVDQRIDETLRRAAQGSTLSSAYSISFSGDKTCPDGTGMLIIYRVKGNPVATALPGRESAVKPIETIQAGGEGPDTPPFTFLGYILENCSLDSPKQLV